MTAESYVEAAVGAQMVILTCWAPTWDASRVEVQVRKDVVSVGDPGQRIQVPVPVGVHPHPIDIHTINGVTEVRLRRK